jgi:hypothetical protein
MHKIGFIVYPAFSPMNFAAASVFETFPVTQQMCDLRRDIVIEQELHRSSSLTCSVTKASICCTDCLPPRVPRKRSEFRRNLTVDERLD